MGPGLSPVERHTSETSLMTKLHWNKLFATCLLNMISPSSVLDQNIQNHDVICPAGWDDRWRQTPNSDREDRVKWFDQSRRQSWHPTEYPEAPSQLNGISCMQIVSPEVTCFRANIQSSADTHFFRWSSKWKIDSKLVCSLKDRVDRAWTFSEGAWLWSASDWMEIAQHELKHWWVLQQTARARRRISLQSTLAPDRAHSSCWQLSEEGEAHHSHWCLRRFQTWNDMDHPWELELEQTTRMTSQIQPLLRTLLKNSQHRCCRVMGCAAWSDFYIGSMREFSTVS